MTAALQVVGASVPENNNADDYDTWGITLTAAIQAIDRALGVVYALATTGGSTTLTDAQADCKQITVSGTLASNATINFPARPGFWIVANGTSGAYSLTLQVTGGGGDAYTVQQGATVIVMSDGTDFTAIDGASLGGAGTMALQDANAVTITGGSISGITDLAVADGGTGASSASAARTNLGLVIGSDVQAYSTHLAAIAALAKTDGNIIVANGTTFVAESGNTARTSLGLGTGDSPTFTVVTATGGGVMGSDAAAGVSFYLNGAAANAKAIQYQTGGLNRFWMGITNEAESGSNAGSNWVLSRYSDAGGWIANAIQVDRDDGTITFGGTLINPDNRLDIYRVLASATPTAALPAYGFVGDEDNGMFLVTTNTLGFSTAGTRRWWLNDAGSWNLSGGAAALGVGSGTTNGISWQNGNNQLEVSSPNAPLNLQRTGTNGSIVNFYRGTTGVGDISVTTTATAYNTSSDYRLKTNLRPINPALLDLVKVYEFDWINGDGAGMGVIAHELAEVLPQAVTGEKDDPERMQSVDYSKLVPLLIAKVQALEARLAALGG